MNTIVAPCSATLEIDIDGAEIPNLNFYKLGWCKPSLCVYLPIIHMTVYLWPLVDFGSMYFLDHCITNDSELVIAD